jgi:hypothetical protein
MTIYSCTIYDNIYINTNPSIYNEAMGIYFSDMKNTNITKINIMRLTAIRLPLLVILVTRRLAGKWPTFIASTR